MIEEWGDTEWEDHTSESLRTRAVKLQEEQHLRIEQELFEMTQVPVEEIEEEYPLPIFLDDSLYVEIDAWRNGNQGKFIQYLIGTGEL